MTRSCIGCVIEIMDLNTVWTRDRLVPLKEVYSTWDRIKPAISIKLMRALQESDFDTLRQAIEPMIKIRRKPLRVLLGIAVVRVFGGVLSLLVAMQQNFSLILR